MFESKDIYRKIYRKFTKIVLIFFLMGTLTVWFLVHQQKKLPLPAVGLLNFLPNATGESHVFQCLDQAVVFYEAMTVKTERIEADQSGQYTVVEYQPKHCPLFDSGKNRPVEGIVRNQGIIPFRETKKESLSNAFWQWEQKKSGPKKREGKIVNDDPLAVFPMHGGYQLSDGSISHISESKEGLKEMEVFAANWTPLEWSPDVDPASHMKLLVEDEQVGEAIVRAKDLSPYRFQYFTIDGLNKWTLVMANPYYDSAVERRRQLFIREIFIYDVLHTVSLWVRRGFEARYPREQFTFSYLRSLPHNAENQLLNFYREQFQLPSLLGAAQHENDLGRLVTNVSIAGLARRSVFAPAPTTIKIPVKVSPQGIKITFCFGLVEEAWSQSGDGVEFRISVPASQGEPATVLFSQYINPKSNKKDRRWFQGSVDLSRYKGREIELLFETVGSMISPINPASDTAYDWAVWSE